MNSKIQDIEKRLEEIEHERQVLASELAHLRNVQCTDRNLPILLGVPASNVPPQSSEEKIELFLKLFVARESVFPKLWENLKKGSKGYSPACNNEWVRGICNKPQIKCSECAHQAFPKLDAQAIRDHLQGKHTIGTYAIREYDSCVFLAADFDGKGWALDVIAYRTAARELGIQIEVERSRSGSGAHGWIFFAQPISERLARQLGTMILARAFANRHTMSLDTYDRFFPNQDFLPKGGFGNLIALPLQKTPRDSGNSIFLKNDLSPSDDQWTLLANARRLSFRDIQSILDRQLSKNSFSLVQFEDESVALAEKALDSGSDKVATGSFPNQI
jgi:hypothetical protein